MGEYSAQFCCIMLETCEVFNIPGPEEYIQCAQAEMLYSIADITPATAISSMLQSNGLQYICTTVHSLTSPASNMFHQWLTLEENTAAVIEDDPHGDDEEEPAEEELGSPKKLELLNQILTHAHNIHNL